MKECCEKHLYEQFGQETAEDLYKLYVESVAEKLAELEEALQAEDWAKLDAAAHTIKGNALAAGDAQMAIVAIEMRSAAELHATERCSELISKVKMLQSKL